MKNKQNALYAQRKRLYKLRDDGVPFVDWKLTNEQWEYLSKFFRVEPLFFHIRTKAIKNIKDVNDTLLLDVHLSYKRGKTIISRELDYEQKQLLTQNGISYYSFKYRIFLRTSP